MTAGRPRKPTALKVLQGNPRRRPNVNEPVFGHANLEPPDWIEDYGLDLWNRVAPMLARNGVLRDVDYDLLAAGCERWTVYRRAAEASKALLVKSPANGIVSNPLLAIARQALSDATAIFREFGIGPASRSKVNADGMPDEDDFARRFG